MSGKLTLSIDKKVVAMAKQYAAAQGRSLSNLVEEYLKSLATHTAEGSSGSDDPLVRELWGSVPYKTDLTDKELLHKARMKKLL